MERLTGEPDDVLDIKKCVAYGSELFDMLEREFKDLSLGMYLTSRAKAAAKNMLAEREKIEKQILLHVNEENSQKLVLLFRQIEAVVRAATKGEMPDRPLYLSAAMHLI